MTWTIYVDKSSNESGCGAGLILNSLKLKCLKIEYVLRLGFKASNNETEYEALIARLRLAWVVVDQHLDIFSDS